MNEHAFFDCFMEKTAFPADAAAVLRTAKNRVFARAHDPLYAAIDRFYQSECSLQSVEEALAQIAQQSEEPVYTVHLLFILFAFERMQGEYQQKGIPETVFWATVTDLKYKAMECKQLNGIWGTFVGYWYPIFFRLDLFALGRLQFQRTSFKMESYEANGLVLHKGDPVFEVHIPSCGPLTEERRLDSYKRAYDFFKEELKDGRLVCVCHSWLLYPQNRSIFPPDMNLVDFLRDWDIVESEDTPDFPDAWRVFNCKYDGDASKLPENTRMQRAMKQWLAQGHSAGVGFGVLVFDGEKILHHQDG